MNSVNDAHAVSLSPGSCVINAGSGNTSVDLSTAYTIISVTKGTQSAEFTLELLEKSEEAIQYVITDEGFAKRVVLVEIGTASSGCLKFKVSGDSGFESNVTFVYTVVHDALVYKWLEQWDSNKTEIGGEYVVTPTAFIGLKDDSGNLTGTFIGQSLANSGNRGIYGYNAGKVIFSLDNTGGLIGGWTINESGIASVSDNGSLEILSEGTIKSKSWQLNADGSAQFANGNVVFGSGGDASFTGKITSSEGVIAGWNITANSIYNQTAIIDSTSSFIGVKTKVSEAISTALDFYKDIRINGGVAMFYSSSSQYGLEGWIPASVSGSDMAMHRVFAIGSVNEIAGWTFNDTTFAAKHVVLSNNDDYAGLFVSHETLSDSTSKCVDIIAAGNGIAIGCTSEVSTLTGVKDGKVIFCLNTKEASKISGWSFDNSMLYSGSVALDDEGLISGEGIMLSPDGIRNSGWRLEKDGSGAVASGSIQWTADGDVTFSGKVQIGIENFNSTIIEDGYIKSEYIRADNITAGSLVVGNTDGRRVQIMPEQKAVEIYNEYNELCLKLDGIQHTSETDGIFADDISGTYELSDDVAMLGGSKESGGKNVTSSNTASFLKIVELTPLRYSLAPTQVVVTSGMLRAYVETTISPTSTSNSEEEERLFYAKPSSVRVDLVLYTYLDANCEKLLSAKTIASIDGSTANMRYSAGPHSDGGYLDITNASAISDSGGFHIVKLLYSVEAVTNTDTVETTIEYGWGHAANGSDNPIALEWYNQYFISQLFANGMVIGTRQNDYFKIMREGANMVLRMETGGNYLQIDKTGIKYCLANGTEKYLT